MGKLFGRTQAAVQDINLRAALFKAKHCRPGRSAGAEYQNALRISPENVAALSNLAWILATSADPSLRNGPEAVRLAERADSASSRSETHARVLRILAAAYAEAGQFAEAKETAQHALEAANIQGNTTLADALQAELALYDLALPYHQ